MRFVACEKRREERKRELVVDERNKEAIGLKGTVDKIHYISLYISPCSSRKVVAYHLGPGGLGTGTCESESSVWHCRKKFTPVKETSPPRLSLRPMAPFSFFFIG